MLKTKRALTMRGDIQLKVMELQKPAVASGLTVRPPASAASASGSGCAADRGCANHY